MTRPPYSLTRARRRAESLMRDTCVITRPDPKSPIRKDGKRDGTVVYQGRCKVQSFRAYEQTPTVGGRVATVIVQELHVPIDSPDFKPNDWGTITDSKDSPTLAGSMFTITRPDDKSIQTAQRLGITLEIA